MILPMAFGFVGMNLSCTIQPLSSLEIPENDCLLHLLAKILGYCIIASSTICKVPQIYLILKNTSIKGISTTASELEVVCFTISLAYCIFKQLPFSAYGELVFLLIQSIIQILLIYYYSSLGLGTWVKAALYCAVAPTIMAGYLDPVLFEALFGIQQIIGIFSRIPQIVESYQNKSTGQLSYMTNLMGLVVCVVRLFTSIQENAPIMMVAGAVLGSIVNGIVFFQIIHYDRGVKEKDKHT
eukprot:c47602_g1_i1 orf=586-1305(-)